MAVTTQPRNRRASGVLMLIFAVLTPLVAVTTWKITTIECSRATGECAVVSRSLLDEGHDAWPIAEMVGVTMTEEDVGSPTKRRFVYGLAVALRQGAKNVPLQHSGREEATAMASTLDGFIHRPDLATVSLADGGIGPFEVVIGIVLALLSLALGVGGLASIRSAPSGR